MFFHMGNMDPNINFFYKETSYMKKTISQSLKSMQIYLANFKKREGRLPFKTGR